MQVKLGMALVMVGFLLGDVSGAAAGDVVKVLLRAVADGKMDDVQRLLDTNATILEEPYDDGICRGSLTDGISIDTASHGQTTVGAAALVRAAAGRQQGIINLLCERKDSAIILKTAYGLVHGSRSTAGAVALVAVASARFRHDEGDRCAIVNALLACDGTLMSSGYRKTTAGHVALRAAMFRGNDALVILLSEKMMPEEIRCVRNEVARIRAEE